MGRRHRGEVSRAYRREGRGGAGELYGPAAGSWEVACLTLLRYGVDIGPRERSPRPDTNLVSLAKRTLGRPRAAEPEEGGP